MRFVSFIHAGRRSYGVLAGGRITDLGVRVGDRHPDLRSYIEGRFPDLGYEATGETDLDLAAVRLLPPIPSPSKIVCVAVNYLDDGESAAAPPPRPLLFLRLAASQVGHGAPLLRPPESTRLDFEGELAVIIGRGGRRIPEDRALSHVAGYSCYNDGTVRDWQKHSSQFTAGKNFFRTGGFGPWMVCSSEVPDPTGLKLETRVNGVTKQRADTARMMFGIPALIAYVSTFTPLVAGDVIVTGTPTGFGSTRNPPEFLVPGDVVEVEIDRIGTLTNPVEDERPHPSAD